MAGFMLAMGCSGSAGENVGSSEEPLSTVCQTGDVVPGIDVSKYQGTIDWTQVKGSGVVFAFARTNDGTYLDPDFAANWKGMKSAGIIRGAYQFFRDSMSGADQADIMLNAMGTLEETDLPPVLDVENGSISIAVPLSTKQTIISDWVAYMKTKTGRLPLVYTGPYFWRDSIKAFDVRPVSLWVAHYTSKKYCPLVPEPWTAWTFHQWGVTDKGTVPGINASVDRDVFNGNQAALEAFVKASHLDAGVTGVDAGVDGSISSSDSNAHLGVKPTSPPDAGTQANVMSSLPAVEDDGGCTVGRRSTRAGGSLGVFAFVAALVRRRRRRDYSAAHSD